MAMAKAKTFGRFKRRGFKPGAKAQQLKANSASAEGPKNKQAKEMSEISGLIFMCNSSTKDDCFKYHVFGLPEAKKGLVEQVEKGMKLFLFNIEEKLLYGVYKASSAGGMNLVKDAFKEFEGKFPAQVRFRVVKECAPLEESAFKQAIKDNYFGRNRFNPQLSSDQVQKLMQLFRPVNAQAEPRPKSKKDAIQPSVTKKTSGFRSVPGTRPGTRAPTARVPVVSSAPAAAARPYPVYPRERPYEGLPPPRKSEAELLDAEAALYRQLREIQQARVEARLASDPYANVHDPYVTSGLPKPIFQDPYPYRDVTYPVGSAPLHGAPYPYDRYL